MTAEADLEEGAAPKKSKMPLILGLVLAILGGAGGFFGVQSGLLPFGGASGGEKTAAEEHDSSEKESKQDSDIAFIALDPLLISIPAEAGRSFLRFSAQLEVNPDYLEEVTLLKPRIIDVLNGYLRAVEIEELEDPSALIRLRAQMLRRLQIVTGEGRVRDLLIMEFVLN